jgi:hypothetical protein
MPSIPPEVAAQYGLSVNTNGGVFRRGRSYDVSKKLEVAIAYQRRLEAGMLRPNKAEIGRECLVGRSFVMKVEEELLLHNKVIDPQELQQRRAHGAGAKCIDTFDSPVM